VSLAIKNSFDLSDRDTD